MQKSIAFHFKKHIVILLLAKKIANILENTGRKNILPNYCDAFAAYI